MLAFFDCRFLSVSRNGGVGKRNLREVGLGGDGSLGAGAGDSDGRGELVDSNAVDGEVVEVRLEVFEIEGEVEDVGVGEGGSVGFLVAPARTRPARADVPSESILRRLFTMMSSSTCVSKVAMMSRP